MRVVGQIVREWTPVPWEDCVNSPGAHHALTSFRPFHAGENEPRPGCPLPSRPSSNLLNVLPAATSRELRHVSLSLSSFRSPKTGLALSLITLPHFLSPYQRVFFFEVNYLYISVPRITADAVAKAILFAEKLALLRPLPCPKFCPIK